jgi:hypothetical protein
MLNLKTQHQPSPQALQHQIYTTTPTSASKLLVHPIRTLQQSPVSHIGGGFRLGSIIHQSSPYSLNQQKYFVHQQHWVHHQTSYNEPHNSNTSNDDDGERPQVFQVEDIPTTLMSNTSKLQHQHSNSLNVSSPTNKSANDSFLSSQTKSSLKTSLSTNSHLTSATASSREVKHVKFKSDQQSANADSPIMFSRSSSLTSLNSFDVKSVHSSVASEYSRRQSGAASPSDLPDSPDGTYILHKQYLLMKQQQQQHEFINSQRSLNYTNKSDLSRLTTDSRSNEITIVERTILGGAVGSGNSNSNSEKNSFYCKSNSSMVDVTKYNVEDSPWRTEQNSANASNLSAPTFDDEHSERGELNAIFSLLKTRTKTNLTATLTTNTIDQHNGPLVSSAKSKHLTFTPPVKLAAIKEAPNFAQHQHYTTQLDDMPKLYCDENTPGNISPYSSMSELSVPSLIKHDTGNQIGVLSSKTFNLNLLLTKLNLNTSFAGIGDCDEIPKVYDTEDHNETTKPDCFDKTSESIIDTDSPKVFLTEDTPMCYSHYSSVNSLANDTDKKQFDQNEQVQNMTIVGCADLLDATATDKLNKSNSVLLSDSCHKPTNTPAGLGNMSRASFNSSSSSSQASDDEAIGLNDVEEQKEDEEDEDETRKTDANTINEFLNGAMPACSNNRDLKTNEVSFFVIYRFFELESSICFALKDELEKK